MKAEDLRIHIRSTRSLATRVELHGDPNEARMLREFASRMERDLQDRTQDNIHNLEQARAARDAAHALRLKAVGGKTSPRILPDLKFGGE
jgi:hypothetical protein